MPKASGYPDAPAHRVYMGGAHPARRACVTDRAGRAVLLLGLLWAATTLRADVGPSIKIRMPVDSPRAVAGEPYNGVLLIEAGRAGIIGQVEVKGKEWTVQAIDQPTPGKAMAPGVLAVPFQAIPRDPNQPVEITVTYNGRTIRRAFRLGPQAFEQRGKDRAAVQIPPAEAAAPPAAPAAKDFSKDGPHANGSTLRFTGRIVYTRPSALDSDQKPIWANSTDEGVHGIWVEVMDEDAVFDETIWSGFTDENGFFDSGEVNWDDCDVTGCDVPDIYLRFECDTPYVNVQDANDILEEDYSWSNVANVVDDWEGSLHNFGTLKPADLSQMAPLHIHTSIVRAHHFIRDQSGTGISVEEVDVQWPDSGDNAYYDPFFEEIFISPFREWEEGSHTHEYGHHFLENYAVNIGSDYCNGFCDEPDDCGHCRWCEETANDAWNEGFPNWLADVVTRDYPTSYTFSDGTPWQALMPRPLETLGVCGDDGQLHDPFKTEGFLGALLRDIDDDTQDEHDNDGDGSVDVDGITDCLALGVDEIFTIATLSVPPQSPADFIERFLDVYPQHRNALWSTAFNVHPGYTTGGQFPLDSMPPGEVQAVVSSSHPAGIGGPLPCISLEWASPPDDVSGACAYSIEWGTDPAGIQPDLTEEITASCVSITQGPFGLGNHYISIRARDCVGNWSPQWATFGPFTVTECNDNGVPDVCDIFCGASWGGQIGCSVPDNFCLQFPTCGSDEDCNNNLIPDQCDIDEGTSEDCNLDGVPDECQPLLHWAGGTGSWHTPSNWLEGAEPGNGDFVCIDDPDETVTVTYTQGDLNLVSLTCSENLTIQTPPVSAPFAGMTLFQDSVIAGDLSLLKGIQQLSLTVNENLNVAGTLHWTGGTLDGPGTTYVNGMDVGNGVATLDGHALKLSPFGTGVATGRIDLRNGAILHLQAGSIYTHTGSFLDVFGGVAGTLLDLDGVLIKKTDTGTRKIDTFVDNSGEIRVEAGTLSLMRGSSTSGQIKTLPGATIQFTGGGHELLPGSSLVADQVQFETGVVGENTVRGLWNVSSSVMKRGQTLTFMNGATIVNYGPDFSIPSGIVNFDATVGGTIHFDSFSTGQGLFNSGTANFNSGEPVEIITLAHGPGTISGTGPITITGAFTWRPGSIFNGPGVVHVNCPMTIELSGGAKSLANRTMNNAALATIQGSFGMSGGAQFNNLATGTMDIQINGPVISFTNDPLNNAGVIVKTAGASTAMIGAALTTTGTVEVRTGTLSFERDYLQTAGLTFLNGGNLAMSGAPVKPMQIHGGTLRGAGMITGTVQNTGGSLEPGGSPGILNVTGAYTQAAGATLRIELAGSAPGSGHDQLTVTGTAQLAGALVIEQPDGYVPAPGQQFVILTAGSVQGAFASVSGPGTYTVEYLPNEVVLNVIAGCTAFSSVDFDADCDVDLADLAAFNGCGSGPAVPLAGGCEDKDLDTDGDVDQEDFGVLQTCFSGESRLAEPDCPQ